MRVRSFINFILFIAAIGAGVYYQKDIFNFYKNFNNSLGQQVYNFKQIEIVQKVSEIGEQIINSSPLIIGGGGGSDTLAKSKIISETNIQRQLNGLPALKENAILDSAAATKANDMFLKQYFEHISPSGIGPGELAKSHGYEYILVGENLILGNFSSEKEIVQKWMESPAHRENVLNKRFLEIGVAIIKGKYENQNVWIGVQEFGLPLSNCPEPSVAIKKQYDNYKTQLENISFVVNETKKEIDNTDKDNSLYVQLVNNYNQLVAQYNQIAGQAKEVIDQYNSQVRIFNQCIEGQ